MSDNPAIERRSRQAMERVSQQAAQERGEKDKVSQYWANARDMPLMDQRAPWSPDANTQQSRGFQRWASMVPEMMADKVISAQFVADQMGGSLEEAQQYLGGDFASINDLVALQAQKMMLQSGLPVDDESAQTSIANAIEGTRQALTTGEGTGWAIGMAERAKAAVAQHAPRGEYAQYAGRAPHDADAAKMMYGQDAPTYVTAGGQQNHRALRVSEFFSAASPEYAPASGFSQFARVAGGFAAPAMRGLQWMVYGNAKPWNADINDPKSGPDRYVNGVMAPLMDYQRMQEVGGKYDYAADMAQRSDDGPGEQRVFTPSDRAKYYSYDPYTGPGMAYHYMDSGQPIGYGTNYLFGNKQWGDYIGKAMQDTIYGAEAYDDAAREVRLAGNTITPNQIAGMTQQDFERARKAVGEGDAKSDSYASALIGPRIPFGGQTTYLSPMASGAINILGELVADPLNVAYTVGAPAVGGAIGGGKAFFNTAGKSMIPRLKAAATEGAWQFGTGTARAAGNMFGDAVDEGVLEPTAFSPALGIDTLLRGQEDNALMGDTPASEATVDKVLAANTQRLVDQNEALEPLVKQRQKEQEEQRRQYNSQQSPLGQQSRGGRVAY